MSLRKTKRIKIKVKVKKIDAGGGVVFRTNENNSVDVLLIFRNGVWDIPKGKREKGESKKGCARREVMEEVNASKRPKVVQKLVSTFHIYEEKGKEIHKTTYWYSMIFESEQSFEPQKEEGITKVGWFKLDEAIEMVGFENLQDVLIDFKKKYKA